MTNQERVKALLEKTGIPAKEIQVFGSQILITCRSHGAAEKFADVVGKFATVRGITETVDYAKVNKGGCMNPTVVKVWRLGAYI